MTNPAAVFHALGDPTRLAILQRMAPDRPSNLGVLSTGLGISRQGARKHLQVLVDADLVRLTPSGRDVLARLNPTALVPCQSFLTELERRWDERLSALKAFVEASVPLAEERQGPEPAPGEEQTGRPDSIDAWRL